MIISDSHKISSIKEEFSALFPYLKLEFFTQSHLPGGASHRRSMITGDKTIGECRTKHTAGEIIVKAGMTVNDLEQEFHNGYGLNVQVFRSSGKVWLETTLTDSWTLEKQNEQGRDLSESVEHDDDHG